jgi:hypothetical protein
VEEEMKTVLGVVMILLALVLAIAPAFTDCESQGKMLTTADGRSVSMKCHWTGVAEIAAAGAMAILLPTFMIGVCGNPMMTCNLLMRPVLLASGILAIVASIALFVIAREPELPAAQAAA